MLSATELQKLTHFAFGRRFLLNLEYSFSRNLFGDNTSTLLFLIDILSNIDVDLSEELNLDQIHAKLGDGYYNSIAANRNIHTTGLSNVVRIFDIYAFAFGSHPLLDTDALRNAGYVFGDITSPSRMQLLAKFAQNQASISNSPSIRTRHPFAWGTDDFQLASIFDSLLHDADEHGCNIVRRLALCGYPDGTPLFILRFPESIANKASFRRPTAVEGLGNKFFKARTITDSDRISKCGYTLDLEELGEVDQSYLGSCDGAPEYVMLPTLFSEKFEVRWCGNYTENWENCNEQQLLTILSGKEYSAQTLDETVENIIKLTS